MSDAADPSESLADAQTRMVRRLAEIGMELAELTARQARAAVEADATASLAGVDLQFSRIARAVRMTLLLEQRMAQAPAAAPKPRPWEEAGLTQAAWRRRENVESGMAVVYDVIEKAIELEPDEMRQDELTIEFAERLESGVDDALFAANAPLGEVIAAICRDLDLRPDWREQDAEDWGLDEVSLARLRLDRFEPPSEAEPDPEPAASAPPDTPRPRPRAQPPPWMS